MCADTKTMKGFIEEILETETQDAIGWFEAFKKGFPISTWNYFLQNPITKASIESLASGIAIQISKAIRKMPKDTAREKLEAGHRFLREFYEKAIKRGIETELKVIDWIYAPELGQSDQALKKSDA